MQCALLNTRWLFDLWKWNKRLAFLCPAATVFRWSIFGRILKRSNNFFSKTVIGFYTSKEENEKNEIAWKISMKTFFSVQQTYDLNFHPNSFRTFDICAPSHINFLRTRDIRYFFPQNLLFQRNNFSFFFLLIKIIFSIESTVYRSFLFKLRRYTKIIFYFLSHTFPPREWKIM